MDMLQGIISNGTALLMAVMPAASPSIQSAAVIALAAGLTAVLQPTGTVVTMHPGKDTLPWQAFYAAAYVVGE